MNSFERVTVTPQADWHPTITAEGHAPVARERFDLDASFQRSPERAELSDTERLDAIHRDLRAAEQRYVEQKLADLSHERSGSHQTAETGSDLIKNIIRMNQATLSLSTPEDARRTQISPEQSMYDIQRFLELVIDHDPRFRFLEEDAETANKQRGHLKNQIKESIGQALIGARAEFAIADCLQETFGKNVFFPATTPVNEDLSGIDWWASLGKNRDQQRVVTALQVKSVERMPSAKNRVLYDLPLNDRSRLCQTVDELVGLLGDDGFQKIDGSLQRATAYARTNYPNTRVTLAILNPLDDIDHKTGVLLPHAADKVASFLQNSIESRSREAA
jgi:hypothetical protein